MNKRQKKKEFKKKYGVSPNQFQDLFEKIDLQKLVDAVVNMIMKSLDFINSDEGKKLIETTFKMKAYEFKNDSQLFNVMNQRLVEPDKIVMLNNNEADSI